MYFLIPSMLAGYFFCCFYDGNIKDQVSSCPCILHCGMASTYLWLDDHKGKHFFPILSLCFFFFSFINLFVAYSSWGEHLLASPLDQDFLFCFRFSHCIIVNWEDKRIPNYKWPSLWTTTTLFGGGAARCRCLRVSLASQWWLEWVLLTQRDRTKEEGLVGWLEQ